MTGNVFFFGWEPGLLQWIQQQTNSDLLIKAASVCTELGEEIVLIGILGFLYWGYKKEYGRYIGINILTALIWATQLKSIFLRQRPYLCHEGIECRKPFSTEADITNLSAQGYSFPSGHSTNAVAAYGSLASYKNNRVLWVLAVIMTLLIGCSRMVLGMHYPTDVLGGWAIGGIAIAVGTMLQKKIKSEKVLYLILIITGLPGMFYCKSEEYFMCYGVMIGAFAGFLFEGKFVNFRETEKWIPRILRVIGGIVIFLILSKVTKLPFSNEFLTSGTYAAYVVRLCRYTVITFADIGIYPLVFIWLK